MFEPVAWKQLFVDGVADVGVHLVTLRCLEVPTLLDKASRGATAVETPQGREAEGIHHVWEVGSYI
jgi:hypothetical protein